MTGIQRRDGENDRSALGLVIVRNIGSIVTLVLAIAVGAMTFGSMQGQVNAAEKERAAITDELKVVREILRQQAETNGTIKATVESTKDGVSAVLVKIEELQRHQRENQ